MFRHFCRAFRHRLIRSMPPISSATAYSFSMRRAIHSIPEDARPCTVPVFKEMPVPTDASAAPDLYSLCRYYVIQCRKTGDSGELPRRLLRLFAGFEPCVRDLSHLRMQRHETQSESDTDWERILKEAGSDRGNEDFQQKSLLRNSKCQSLETNVANLIEADILEKEGALTAADLSALMAVHSRNGDSAKVLDYFQLQKRIGAVTRESYWMVIRAFAESKPKDMDSAMMWFHFLQSDEAVEKPGIRVFRTIFYGYTSDSRTLDLAQSWLLEYERTCQRPGTLRMYNTLLEELVHNKSYENVQIVFRRMRCWGVEPDVKAWNMYLSSFKGQAHGIEAAKCAVDEAVYCGIIPDVGTYYSLMEVHAAAGDVPGAGRQCEKALRRGFLLSTRMWHVLFVSLLQRRDSDTFDRHFASVQKKLPSINSNYYFQSLLLRRFASTGENLSAIAATKTAVSSGIYPRRFTYDVLMKSLILEGHYNYAIKLFEQMHQTGVVGIHATYHSLLVAQIRNLEFAQNRRSEFDRIVKDTFAIMKENANAEPTVDTFNAILSALVGLSDPDLVFHFLHTWDFVPNVITFTLLLKMESSSPKAAELQKLVSSSTSGAWRGDDDAWKGDDIMSFSSALRISTEPSSPPSSSTIPAIAFDCIFFTAMFSLLGNQKRVQDLHHFADLFQDFCAKGYLKPDIQSFNSLMAAFTRIDDYEAALKVYQLSVDAKSVPTKRTFTVLLLVIAKLGHRGLQDPWKIQIQCSNDRVKELDAKVMPLYRFVTQECGVVPDMTMFRVLVRVCSLSGDLGMAKEVVDEMDKYGVGGEEAFSRFRRTVLRIK
ncbi:hypothetical protein HDU77_011435 [Chytriomyces hyalinus]|nr:hypothetical protein HDU77_011435 [Chytriomyces hyalinus]